MVHTIKMLNTMETIENLASYLKLTIIMDEKSLFAFPNLVRQVCGWSGSINIFQCLVSSRCRVPKIIKIGWFFAKI